MEVYASLLSWPQTPTFQQRGGNLDVKWAHVKHISPTVKRIADSNHYMTPGGRASKYQPANGVMMSFTYGIQNP